MKVYELYKWFKENKQTSITAFLGHTNDLDDFSFMADYVADDFHKTVDALQSIHRFAGLPINLPEEMNFSDAYDFWEESVMGVLNTNKYKYETLFQSMLFVYNPVENYDMTEDGTDTTDPRTDSTQYGQQTHTFSKGAENNVTTNVQDTTGYNTVTAQLDNKLTSTETVASYNDSNQYAQHTDTQNIDEVKTTHHLERHGNIGTMTAQDLIEKERQVALFSFYQLLYDDIMEYLTIPIWDYEEV